MNEWVIVKTKIKDMVGTYSVSADFTEELLKKIKTVDTHNTKIPLLEQTIIRLKLMLEQKVYV